MRSHVAGRINPENNLVYRILIICMLSPAFFPGLSIAQTISGAVVDDYTGMALSDVRVIIYNSGSGETDSTTTDANGNWYYSFTTSVSGVDDIPLSFSLEQNYPNPFNPGTTIKFRIASPETIELNVYNVLGQLMDRKTEFLYPGQYAVPWHAKGSAGVYFYSIRSGSQSVTRKMVQLDGGSGYGFGEIEPAGSGSGGSIRKEKSLPVSLIFSRLDYLTDTTDVVIAGGESIGTSLKSVHRSAVMIDLHNDVLYKMVENSSYRFADLHTFYHTDIPRMRTGGVDIQLFVAWVSPTRYPDGHYSKAVEMFEIFKSEVELNPDDLQQAENPDEALQIVAEGKIAGILCVEGGHSIENSLEKLANLYHLGMRYLTITWNNSTEWAVSAQDALSSTIGLSEFGRQVIRALDSLGVIIDVSHTGIKTIQDILEVTSNPIIASHSGVRALRYHYRNLYDDQIVAIAEGGGVIGIPFYPPFLWNPSSAARIEHVVRHINYIVELVGVDHVAIGSDFDGIETTPPELEDVSKFPALTKRLLEEGYSREDVYKILGGNFISVFQQVHSNRAGSDTNEE